jgi:hypothetical protein
MPDHIQCPDCARQFASAYALAQHRTGTHDNPAWQQSKNARPVPLCPICGNPATLSAGKYGTKAACCGLWSWDCKPLVGRETHAARIQAHAAFDVLWKSATLSRGESYRRLRIAMGLGEAECHIARMSAEQARRVVALVRAGALGAVADGCDR